MNARLILLVEDNQDDVELTTRALRDAGVQVKIDVAKDGVEALEYLLPGGEQSRTRSPLPAVVLLDLKLPKVGGLEVLGRLRSDERTRLLPIVILTSSNHTNDLELCYASGCNSYVRKPVDFTRFLQVLRQLGSYWLEVNEPAPRAP